MTLFRRVRSLQFLAELTNRFDDTRPAVDDLPVVQRGVDDPLPYEGGQVESVEIDQADHAVRGTLYIVQRRQLLLLPVEKNVPFRCFVAVYVRGCEIVSDFGPAVADVTDKVVGVDRVPKEVVVGRLVQGQTLVLGEVSGKKRTF